MAARTPPRRGAPIRGALLGALLALAALLWPAAVRAAEAAPPFPASPTSQADLALVGGTVLTVTRGTIERGTVLVRGGRIAAVGRELPVPPGARTIDCTGRYLMPGIIDTHSHMGVYPWTIARGNADGNEATQPLTPHVRAADSIYLEDPAFERARAGGVTAVLVIPGSANLIGGEGVVLKLRPGGTLAAMRLEGAPRQLKMAMGENPKRVYGSRGEMPSTRMGNLAYLREAFARARTYRARWREFEQARAAAAARNEPLGLLRPDYDAELELLAQVLEGELRLQVHCYTRSDILALLRLADEVGLEIAALHHAVEAYKVAPELARRGIGVCTWADWWGFKQEAWDAIPENAAICARAGVTVAIHSDSSAQVQKLYLEAAKTIAHGMSPEAALAAITIGPARILGIDDRVGSIEPGKDADLAVFSGHPFTAAARVELTLIDGEVVYDRAAAEAKGPPLPPPLPEPAHVVIRGARVLPVAGAPIDNGVIEIAGGRIVAVGGPATPVSPQARAIEARGRTVFPGLIDAFSHVGLVEVGSDPALRETDAIGGLMLPHLRVTDGLLPDSETVRVARAAGVTTCLLAPEEHNAIAGMAAVVDLLGGTVEDMVVLDPAALCLNLGTSPVAFGRERRELGTRMELVARLRAYLVEAEEYGARWERHARERARYNERFGRWLRERARRKLWGWLAPPGAGEARRRSRDGDGGRGRRGRRGPRSRAAPCPAGAPARAGSAAAGAARRAAGAGARAHRARHPAGARAVRGVRPQAHPQPRHRGLPGGRSAGGARGAAGAGTGDHPALRGGDLGRDLRERGAAPGRRRPLRAADRLQPRRAPAALGSRGGGGARARSRRGAAGAHPRCRPHPGDRCRVRLDRGRQGRQPGDRDRRSTGAPDPDRARVHPRPRGAANLAADRAARSVLARDPLSAAPGARRRPHRAGRRPGRAPTPPATAEPTGRRPPTVGGRGYHPAAVERGAGGRAGAATRPRPAPRHRHRGGGPPWASRRCWRRCGRTRGSWGR
ncbi:MAG: hypothetical protein KatS3mg102_0196 [Planctomycetota bacterium]|nr:MAG: hypothetical protein KatS3mg102_0196 [Planctomycetota bacterium]